MLAKLLRLINHIVFFKLKIFLLGMVFFRLARKLKNLKNKNKTTSNFKITDHCLGNLKMELDLNSYMGGCIYWSGYHHINESVYLDKFLKSDMTFIDIGANQGEFTLLASKYIKQGKIISFEPVSKNIKRLKQNIELNKIQNIELNQFGLSDKNERLPIFTNPQNLVGGVNEGLSTLFSDKEKTHFEENVEVKVFDEIYFSKLERLDFIKIDIEGAELFALKGMHKTIEKFSPDILLEINEPCFNAAGYSSQELINYLKELDYSIYKLFRGKLFKTEKEEVLKWGNYIFKKNGK